MTSGTHSEEGSWPGHAVVQKRENTGNAIASTLVAIGCKHSLGMAASQMQRP